MNASTIVIRYGQRVPIARDRWSDHVRAERVALAAQPETTGRWGATPRCSQQLSSSAAR